jgi:hypothetical protein
MAPGPNNRRSRSMSRACAPSGWCVMEMLATVWVRAYHAAFKGSETLEQENAELRMSLIHNDLSSCSSRLSERGAELEAR